MVDALEPLVSSGNATGDTIYQFILALARGGASTHALKMFLVFRDKLPDTEDSAALEARIFKNRYRESLRRDDAKEYLEKACAIYERIFRNTGGFYSGIHAAKLSYLADDATKAQRLAEDVLAVIETSPADY